jgi:SfnB family sulfur acquisition oxidoreductase
MTATRTPAAQQAPAHVIASDAEAVETARALAREFARGASERDRERHLPAGELDQLSRSGLLAAAVPARFGGAEVSVATLTEVFRILATVDASLAQIPHSHFVFLDALRLQGTEAQQASFFAEALAGQRFANAQSERGGKTIVDDSTVLRRHDEGTYRLDGEKFYCTGALFADWLAVRAVLDGQPLLANGTAPKAIAFVRRDEPGVTVEDDWDAVGQRTTASGTVRLDGVIVPVENVVPYSPIFDVATTYGSRAQVLHAALDVGIARGALDATIAAVAKARPWFEAGVERAADDPLLVQQAGELEIAVRGAEALLREAATAIDSAEWSGLSETNTAEASVATAVAKVACARVSTDAASQLFELGGTRCAAAGLNLSRYWRDARTHTLHDPSRWKVQHVGHWLLDGTAPPRHGLL